MTGLKSLVLLCALLPIQAAAEDTTPPGIAFESLATDDWVGGMEILPVHEVPGPDAGDPTPYLG